MNQLRRGWPSMHPLVVFLYYIGALAIIMIGGHPFFLGTCLLLLILLNGIQENFRSVKKRILWYLGIALFILILTPLFNHRGTHILFYFQNNPIMLESVLQGGIFTLSLLSLLTLFISYNLVITPGKFLYLFAGILPQWALLAMLTMRFVPLFQRRLGDIETVQRTKGISIREGGWYKRIKSAMQILRILLEWSLEEAIQTADSMMARGYGTGKRSRYTPYSFHLNDGFALIFILSTLGLLIFGWWLGDLVLSITPELEPIFLSGREWFYFIIYVLYFGFPLVVEGRERCLWHFSQQKI
ncbi:MAG: energy-coupling factor transporter transmembrane component T [Tuberibacillus sp.]